MSSRYIQKFPSPPLFDEIIHDFTKEVLRYQPDDIIEFSALYFKCLQEGVVLDYHKKGQNIPCDFMNVIPKKPVPKAGRVKEDDLEVHNNAVAQSEGNRDKIGVKPTEAQPARAVNKKETVKEASKKQTEKKPDGIEAKKEVHEGAADPPKKDVSSNTLHKISDSFIEDVWGRKSVEIANEETNEKKIKDELKQSIDPQGSPAKEFQAQEKLTDNIRKQMQSILNISLSNDNKQRISTEENNYDYFSENDTNYFPEGLPMQHAVDYFSFYPKVFNLTEYFDGSSEAKAISYAPKTFFGFADVCTQLEGDLYTGVFSAIYLDNADRFIHFCLKYHNEESGKEVNDEVKTTELN